MSVLEITPGFFESRARKSARNAIIRNLIILTLPLAAIALWISIRVSGEPIEPFILCIDLAVFALVAWRVRVAIGRVRDPLKHPIMIDFARFGDARAVAHDVELAAQSGSAASFEQCVITDRFLVVVGLLHTVIELTDIAWMYSKATRHSVNFIPLGTTFSIEIHTFSTAHRWTSLGMTSNSVLLEALQKKAIRARLGFSQENEAWWKATRLKLAAEDREGERA